MANNPTPWEKQWKDKDCDTHLSMQEQVEQVAAKEALNKEDVVKLAAQLYGEGLEEAGRKLVTPNVFGGKLKKGTTVCYYDALGKAPIIYQCQ